MIDSSHPGVRRRKYRLRRNSYSLRTYEKPLEDETIEGSGASSEDDQKLIEELQTQLKDANERNVRHLADLENQRKRFQKEKDEIRKFAVEDLMREITNPMDHFAMAMDSLESATDVNSVKQGVSMIHHEIHSLLTGRGLEEINPVGKSFDPNFHEAIGTEFDPDAEEGSILTVTRRGWKLKDRVLRPAMVLVNRKPVEAKTE